MEKGKRIIEQIVRLTVDGDETRAEVVGELTRCRDCKWFNDFGCAIHIVDDSDKPKDNDFCSFGERKERSEDD